MACEVTEYRVCAHCVNIINHLAVLIYTYHLNVTYMYIYVSHIRALGAFIAYCVIGGIFMYSQKGARGTEVIPNYTFWKDFPFLIKVT